MKTNSLSKFPFLHKVSLPCMKTILLCKWDIKQFFFSFSSNLMQGLDFFFPRLILITTRYCQFLNSQSSHFYSDIASNWSRGNAISILILPVSKVVAMPFPTPIRPRKGSQQSLLLRQIAAFLSSGREKEERTQSGNLKSLNFSM